MRPARGRRNGGATTLQSIEEHAAVYAAVVASALDAVIVVDEAGRVVSINPAAESMFGYSRDVAMGQSIGDLIVPDHLKDAHEKGFARYRETRKPHVLGRRVEMEARCSDGRIIPVELAITEVDLPDRRLFTANLRDLSAAKAAAAEIERQRDALHQSEKLAALGSLLAGVAHELNNPLSIVLGHATLLREATATEGSPAMRVRAEKIEHAAERCARVVRSFLTIARQRKAEMRSVALPPLLDGSIELMLYGLRSAGIAVIRDYDQHLMPAHADPDQVQQIFVNLLVNAMQALESFEGRREISISAAVRPDGKLQIVVGDSGPGVPAAIAQRIFEPFFTTKPQGAGTGIGLSVSRGLAQAQGGELLLVDRPGGGAAFQLILPAVAEATTQQEPSPANGAEPHARAASPTVRRAIVIDDEAEIAIMLAEVLRDGGYVCDVANSGREGIALIAARPRAYDAIICDIRMPDMDGPALFRWIETHHPRLSSRVLFMTGDTLGPSAGRFLASSGRPVLEKPFPPAELMRVVDGFKRRRSSAARPAAASAGNN